MERKKALFTLTLELETAARRVDYSQTCRFLRRNNVYVCVGFCGYVCACVMTHRAKVSLANVLMCGVRSPEIIQTRHQDWTGDRVGKGAV